MTKKREDTIFNTTNSFFSVLVINYLNELKSKSIYYLKSKQIYLFRSD